MYLVEYNLSWANHTNARNLKLNPPAKSWHDYWHILWLRASCWYHILLVTLTFPQVECEGSCRLSSCFPSVFTASKSILITRKRDSLADHSVRLSDSWFASSAQSQRGADSERRTDTTTRCRWSPSTLTCHGKVTRYVRCVRDAVIPLCCLLNCFRLVSGDLTKSELCLNLPPSISVTI